jgi:ABC-type glycerol-3-phosphate transport system substrate-binding protein
MRRMLALIAVSVVLAACGGDEGGTQASGGRTRTEGEGGRESDRAKAATVEVSSSDLGQLLADAEGMTL